MIPREGSMAYLVKGLPLDSAWESLLLVPCPLAPDRRPKLNRKDVFQNGGALRTALRNFVVRG